MCLILLQRRIVLHVLRFLLHLRWRWSLPLVFSHPIYVLGLLTNILATMMLMLLLLLLLLLLKILLLLLLLLLEILLLFLLFKIRRLLLLLLLLVVLLLLFLLFIILLLLIVLLRIWVLLLELLVLLSLSKRLPHVELPAVEHHPMFVLLCLLRLELVLVLDEAESSLQHQAEDLAVGPKFW